MDINECVAEGVKFLDEVRPEWRTLIDLERLDIADPWDCVLGQVFAADAEANPDDTAPNGYAWAHRTFAQADEDFCWTVDLGFGGGANTELMFQEELRLLNEAWHAELTA